MIDLRRLALGATLAVSVLVVVLVVVDAPQSLRALVVFPYLLIVPGLPWAMAFRLGSRMLTLVVAMSLSLGLATGLSYLSYTVHFGRGVPVLVLLAVCAGAGVFFEGRTRPRLVPVTDRMSQGRESV